jgi:methyl-accepting chemotaxis protein
MATLAGSGTSADRDPVSAGGAAAAQACLALADRKPSYGFVFASPEHDLASVLRGAAGAVPGAELLGCSTAGEITERGVTHGGVAMLLVASDEIVDVSASSGVQARPAEVAERACARFAETARTAAAKGFAASTSVVLVDGLCGTGEKLVREILRGTRPYQQVVGGAAGDEGAFKATPVGARGEASHDAAAVLHVFGAKRWGVGVDHGLRPTTGKMQVTRAVGNVIHEIDGRPAFEVYRDYARGRGVTLQPETAGRFLVGNELGIYFLDQVRQARAPLSVGADGSLHCAADVPQGSFVCILDGDADAMVEAAAHAAREALSNLDGQRAAGVLLFDCVCRGMILGGAFRREIDAVRSVFPGVPIGGFLTFKGRLDGWHNTTAVVVAIPA